jgi:hypothetical protein
MKTLLFVISFLIFLSSCIKDPVSSCKQENTLVQVKQYDAIECPYDEFTRVLGKHKEEVAGFQTLQNGAYFLKVCVNNHYQSFKIIKNDAD